MACEKKRNRQVARRWITAAAIVSALGGLQCLTIAHVRYVRQVEASVKDMSVNVLDAIGCVRILAAVVLFVARSFVCD